uniref:[RNA-polymerase]-subunit kinase n=1 Tax=Zea mays TaxID=4577 RepID=A0A804LKA2_MAIZE
MGCVHGRPSTPSPDHPPQPPEPPAPAAAQEATGKAEQPAAPAEKPAPRERRSLSPRSGPGPSFANRARGEQVAAGWPAWLSAVAGEAIDGWTPRRADSFEKIDKIGQGTYSNVYKARDTVSGKIVALKKVRFDNLEPESVRFMAREILILRRLDHPNVVKLDGLVTSRMSCSLYLVFEYMEHDLAGLAASPEIKFTEPQVPDHRYRTASAGCHQVHALTAQAHEWNAGQVLYESVVVGSGALPRPGGAASRHQGLESAPGQQWHAQDCRFWSRVILRPGP